MVPQTSGIVQLSGTQTPSACMWFSTGWAAKIPNLTAGNLQPFDLQRSKVPLLKNIDPVVNKVTAQENAAF